MIKPLLLVMSQNREEHISEMVKNIYPTFDGIVGLVNQPSIDNTQKILEENKGSGRILTQQFTPNHAFLMNHLLFYGGIKEGQWCIFLDSPESMTDNFINDLPYLLEDFERSKIGALYWDGRPYIFKYNPYMEFFGAVHWGLKNIEGNIITTQKEIKDKYIINRRKDNPEISWCLNPIKYWLCYPLGNETEIMYSQYGRNIWEKHENVRKEFRKYCIKNLNLNLNNLTDLIEYMKSIAEKTIAPDDFFIKTVENEYRLSELFQLKILDYDFMTVMHPRNKWSFREYLKSGNGWSNPNFISNIDKYNRK